MGQPWLIRDYALSGAFETVARTLSFSRAAVNSYLVRSVAAYQFPRKMVIRQFRCCGYFESSDATS